MKRTTFFLILTTFSLLIVSCGHRRPSVDEMRQEKRTQDSLDMVAQIRSVVYTDSMLQTLLPVADSLIKNFRYIKNDRYEDHGHYIYRTLLSEPNSTRCFLQASLSDDYHILVRSFYYGTHAANAETLLLSAEGNDLRLEGSLHTFETDGYHEILTLEGEEAIHLLRFADGFRSSRIRVQLVKKDTDSSLPAATYYISEKDKEALCETYRLGIVMQDIHRLEQQQRQASLQVEKYQKRLKK